MRGYFGLGKLSASEKSDILDQHKSVYNGYQTMHPQVSNTQPLTVYDFAGDKEGLVVNNKGEVKKYTNMGINEQVEEKSMCEECGGQMTEGECMECGYNEGEMGEGKKFPDLTGDGEVTYADILKGRGVELKEEEVDYEGEMAKSELYRIIENAEELFQMLDDDTQLEAWVQSKITKAADYIASVSQYLGFQAENKPSIDEKTEYTLDK